MLKSERAFAGESGEATSAAGALLLARVREDVGRADVSDEVVLVLLGAGGRDEGARGGVCAGEVAAAGLQQPHEPVEGVLLVATLQIASTPQFGDHGRVSKIAVPPMLLAWSVRFLRAASAIRISQRVQQESPCVLGVAVAQLLELAKPQLVRPPYEQ